MSNHFAKLLGFTSSKRSILIPYNKETNIQVKEININKARRSHQGSLLLPLKRDVNDHSLQSMHVYIYIYLLRPCAVYFNKRRKLRPSGTINLPVVFTINAAN